MGGTTDMHGEHRNCIQNFSNTRTTRWEETTWESQVCTLYKILQCV